MKKWSKSGNIISLSDAAGKPLYETMQVNLVGVALDQLGEAQELLQGAEDDCAVALEFVESAVAWLERLLESNPQAGVVELVQKK